MELEITFPGGLRVDANLGSGMVVPTNQDGTAPSPWALFISSMGTCAGIFVLHFCVTRRIPTEGVSIIQRMRHNPMTRMIEEVTFDIQVPANFPKKYHSALIRAANQCPVKMHMERPPKMNSIVTVN